VTGVVGKRKRGNLGGLNLAPVRGSDRISVSVSGRFGETYRFSEASRNERLSSNS
jgi:hypothetical protein